MGWRDFQLPTPHDKIDNIDNKPQENHIVDKVDIVDRGELENKEIEVDPFPLSGEAIKVFLPPLNADVWFCSDRESMERVKHEEIACFLYDDLVYIHKGKPGAERLSRLFEVYAKRHPVTECILDMFNGKIKSVKMKEVLP
jgi:hypothetical protein